MTKEELLKTENEIVSLREQSKNLILPRRTIAYQFANMRFGNRDMARELAIRRKQRYQVNKKIAESQNKIVSLRTALGL